MSETEKDQRADSRAVDEDDEPDEW